MERVKIDGKTVEYKIIRSHRKTVGIHLKHGEDVIIRAPQGISKKRIKEIVHKKSKWIFKKLDEMKEMASPPDPLKFVSGEKILYLGKFYQLEVKSFRDAYKETKKNDREIYIEKNNKNNDIFINLEDEHLLIRIPERLDRVNDKSIIKESLIKWYKEEARKNILERIRKYQKYIGRKPVKVRIKSQKTIWGSCSSKGNLNFNWKLIMAPLPVLDYIIVHEMVHLIHPNHSRRYWQMVEKIIPDYRQRKQWLKENGPALDIY
ncbi:MAG: M48 family metallopeptidase [bacterium]